MPNPIDDLRNRGVVDLDIATLENHYTGKPLHPTGSYPVPVRLVSDGQPKYNRKYAPDDQPYLTNIIAMARLPKGFGKYADGLVIVYTTTAVGGRTAYQDGWLNPGDVSRTSGYWPGVPTGKVRVAVHPRSAKDVDYASGWTNVPSLGYDLATTSTGEFYRYDDYVQHRAQGLGLTVALPTAQIVCQRMGDAVLVFIDGDGFRLHPDLSASTIDGVGGFTSAYLDDSDDPVLWLYNRPQRAIARVLVGGAVMSSPLSRLSSIQMSSQRDLNAPLGTDLVASSVGGASYQFFGPVGGTGYGPQVIDGVNTWLPIYVKEFENIVGPHRPSPNGQSVLDTYPSTTIVAPWAAGDYGSPEMWTLVGTATVGTFTLYRSQWKAGEYRNPALPIGTPGWDRPEPFPDKDVVDITSGIPLVLGDDPAFNSGETAYPAGNPRGFAFEFYWNDAAHVISTIRLPDFSDFPQYTTYTDVKYVPYFRVDRDPNLVNRLWMFIGSGYFAGTSTGPFWVGVSDDDGASWSITKGTDIAPRIEQEGQQTLSGYVHTQGVYAISGTGVPFIAGVDSWNYYDPDGHRVPFWNSAPSDAGAHLAFFYIFGPSGPPPTSSVGGSDIHFRTTRPSQP